MRCLGTVTGVVADETCFTRAGEKVLLRVGVEVTLDSDGGTLQYVTPAGYEPPVGARVTVTVEPA